MEDQMSDAMPPPSGRPKWRFIKGFLCGTYRILDSSQRLSWTWYWWDGSVTTWMAALCHSNRLSVLPRTCLGSSLKSSAFQWTLAKVQCWEPCYSPENCEHVFHLCVGVFCFVLFLKRCWEIKSKCLCFNLSSGKSCFSYLHSAWICSLEGTQPSPYLGMFLYFQGGLCFGLIPS